MDGPCGRVGSTFESHMDPVGGLQDPKMSFLKFTYWMEPEGGLTRGPFSGSSSAPRGPIMEFNTAINSLNQGLAANSYDPTAAEAICGLQMLKTA